ncbi:MAG TPA: hypothetical protein VHC41_10950 [Mycobacteriales bacterium]|jgi:hypothetical protein|nr:hypothetical protein [Mycobacteriales bacterium]
MPRLAFTPRWIGGLLFCLTAAAVCGVLGYWQWDVAQARHGSLQNTAYAFNWWLFSFLFVAFWFKALHDTTHRPAGHAHRPRPAVPVPRLPDRDPRVALPARAAALIQAPLPTPEEDPDVAEWNDWLAELNANPRR